MGILIVINNEFRRSLKYKKKLILGMLIPVISIIAALGINSFMKPSINIGIINESTTSVYENLKEDAEPLKGLNIKKANEDSINTDMILGKYAAIIEIDKDNTMKVNSLDSNLKENIEVVMKEYFKSGQLRGFEETLSKIEKENMTVAEQSGGFILLTLIVTCTISACNLIKDKEEGTLKRFYVSPSKASRYIIGTYLYNLINTIAQILIAVIVLMLFKVDIGITSMQLFMIGCIIAIIATSLSTLIVCLSENELQASIVASVIALIMSLLGGSFLPLDKMPTLLKYISNFTITKWLIVFIEKLQNGLINLEILTPIAIMLSLSIVMIISSCKLGKKKFI